MSHQPNAAIDADDTEAPLPDPHPNEVPTAILEQDEDPAPRGMALQTIAFFIGIFLIMLLVLLLGSGGRLNVFDLKWFGGDETDSNSSNTNLELQLSGTGGAGSSSIQNNSGTGSIDGLGTVPDYVANIDVLFRSYWETHGGVRIFGKPISPLLEENGRKFQWFERARLESWPEHVGTKYAVQPGRIGLEFTKFREFPTQEFFTNRPGLYYEEVIQHGIRGEFLKFWLANGGVDTFGYPISDELQEILPEDNAYHTVQYFERARFELHPNAPDIIQLGLLGTGMYKQASEPNIITPIKPTAVPVTP